MSKVFAALLCVGHEVVEGQVINTNGSWLAQQLQTMGIPCHTHLCVRDKPQEIESALTFLKTQRSSLIITTGGLGPTQDDLTTESLCAWLGLPLTLSETSWEEIQTKLNQRNVTLRPGHKRQALMPQGAQELPNPIGVAPGFFLKTDQGLCLASLPGPPSEMKGIFNQYLKPLLKKTFQPRPTETLCTWICLGAAESEVAHIVESVIGDSLPIGFRLHRPYVEVRLWCPETLNSEQSRRIRTMEEKLKPWLTGSSIDKIRADFHQQLKQFDFVFIVDQLSGGLLLERLRELKSSDNIRYQCFEHKSYRHFNKDEVAMVLSRLVSDSHPEQLFISLFPASDHSAWLAFGKHIEQISLPRQIPIQSQLGQLYVIERCFLKTTEMLTQGS